MIDKLSRRTSKVWHQLAQRIAEPARTAAKVWRDTRSLSAERGLSRARILQDVVGLRAIHSVGMLDYFKYRLFEPGLTRSEKLRYLSSASLRGGLSRRLTPVRYRALYDNKLVFNCFFSGRGLPVAEIYAVYDPTVGHTMDGGRRLRTAADLRSWLEDFPGDSFVLKPTEGGRGRQILIFERRAPDDRDTFVTLSGERYDADRLVAFTRQTTPLEARDPNADPNAYLLQARQLAHPATAALVGGPTLCTTRVVTFIALDGAPRILASLFRIQPGPVGVDHLFYGAVGCWVDPETGVLGRGRTRDSLADVTTVPGTDRSFVGFQLPHWPEVKAVALRAAAAFPWARAIGWDIAITDRGPVLLEGNDRWDGTGIQMLAPRGLLTGEFKALCDALARGQDA